MKLEDHIVTMLSQKTGSDVSTAAGAKTLRDDIERVTGQHLALNTVKRLTGVLPYDSQPRRVILDIVARYLGFDSWDAVLDYYLSGVSHFGANISFVDVATLRNGAVVSFEWVPNRKIELEKRDDGRFVVRRSENGKLQTDDIVVMSQICEGFPFLAKEVTRQGNSLGRYVAASETGITNLQITD